MKISLVNTKNSDIKVFAGSSSISFVEKMCQYLNIIPGQSEAFNFQEGNTMSK